MTEVQKEANQPLPSHDAEPSPHPNKQTRWIWVSVATVLIIGAVAFFIVRSEGQADSKKAAHGPPPVSVAVAPVTQGDLGVRVDALGTVTPLQTVTITSRVQGQVMKVAYIEGQTVKPGDPLVDIDARPYQAALLQAQGQLQRDEATLKQSQTNLRRYQAAYRSNAISKQQLDDQVQLVKQYQGAVLSDRGAVDNAQVNLQYCHITAPIAGRVGLRLIDAGNMIQAGSTTPLVVLTQLQPITVIFSVAEDNVFAIQAQSMQNALMPVEAFDRSQTKKVADGKFLTLDNQVDPSTGTVRIKAVFENKDFALFPNEFVNARLLVRTEHGLLRVPTPAVQKGVQGSFVYVITQQDTVKVTPVQTGLSDQGLTAVTGVQIGERVAMSNFDKLQDKAKIRVRDEGATKAPVRALPAQADPNAVPIISGSTQSADSVGSQGGRGAAAKDATP